MTNQVFNDTDELIKFLNSLPNNFVYRGHANASWKLESTLERILWKNWSAENARKFEEYSLQRFMAKFHLYDRENYEPKSKLSWLSMMQHYGVPSRLLDFTESPYVALYFALEFYEASSSNDFAMYAIDYGSLLESSLDYIRQKDKDFNETRTSINGRQDVIFDNIVDRFSYDIVWVTEPAQLNARMDRQTGCFILSGNRGIKLEEILNSDLYKNCQIIKCIISGQLYTHIFALLRKMNLNSSVIYGDLAGLAKAIRMEMQIYAV